VGVKSGAEPKLELPTVVEPRATQQFFSKLLRTTFFRHVLGTYGTQLLMAALSVVTGVIVARALGPEGRGAYAVAMVIAVIGVQLGSLGLQGSNSYFVAKDRTLLGTLLANSLITSLMVGAAGAAAFWLVFHFFRGFAPIGGSLMVLALAGIPVGLAYLFAVNLLMGIREVRLYNTIELMNKALAAALIIAVVSVRTKTPEVLFLVVLVAQAVSLGLALRILGKFSDFTMPPSMSLFRKNLGVGWKVYLSCVFGFLVVRIDLLMVRSMLGAAATGYYSVVGSLGDYVLMLPAAVSALLFPKLSGLQNEKEKQALTLKASAAICLTLLVIVAVLALSAKWVIILLFGKAFAPASTALLLLAPGVFFLGVEVVLVQYLNSCGFPVSVVVLWIISTILNIGLNLWAIPAYGINGAAAVSSVSYLIALFGVAWITHKRWKSLKLYEGTKGDLPEIDGAAPQENFACAASRSHQK
jgi:O-antigen/teichoic acid export membrane protein